MTENDIKEIAKMREQPYETTMDATEASNALVHFLFESVGISVIYGDCDVK